MRFWDRIVEAGKPEQQPEKKKKKISSLEWPSTNFAERGVQDAREYIKQNAFRIKPSQMVGRKKDGSIATMDSCDGNLSDPYNGTGLMANEAVLGWYVSQGFIGFQSCTLIAQQWAVNKACTMPAQDAVRNGYEITVNDGKEVDTKILAELRSLDKLFRVSKMLVEQVKFKRVYGIRHCLFVVDSRDKDYYLKPFDIKSVKPGTYRGMSQIDPYWITPELDMNAVSNPADPHFYEATYWTISGNRYHRSHFVIARGPEVGDILKPSYLYAGLSIPQLIMERIYAAERVGNEAPLLCLTKRLNVLKTDLAKAMQKPGAFFKKLKDLSFIRDNFGTRAVDLEDEIQQIDTSLSDLDAVIMTQFQLVAAICDVPATKLLGTSPKGFGASGDYEVSNYHQMLESIQADDLTPLLDRHYQLLIKSQFDGALDVTINWKPLDTLKAVDVATIQKLKAETDTILQDAGAIDHRDIKERLIADPESGFNGMVMADLELKEDQTGAPLLSSQLTPQDVSMNGAQVISLIETVSNVATGQIPRETGVEILKTAFSMSEEEASKMMGSIGKSFTPEPAQTVPVGAKSKPALQSK